MEKGDRVVSHQSIKSRWVVLSYIFMIIDGVKCVHI